ncbi:MAG: fatty acid desaturase, partial [Verrucomicrobia subdivision 3 bacterium]|nr:fatty acid desaturase [Limisphaerales bacterium]
QTLWQQRHLAHHAGQPWRWRVNGQLLAEFACVGALWIGLIAFAPRFLVAGYLPGWLLGLALCQLQGYYEHARGTTSHYGWLYNLLLFNDGFHVEHHRRPARHWTRLPQDRDRTAHASRWPAVLRWLDWFSLEGLERCVLRLRWLQPFVIGVHERALDKLVSKLSPPKRVAVVGGALFPRTALALQRLLPNARVVIIDSNYENIVEAKRFLNGHAQYEHRTFRSTSAADEFDLVIIPLSFRGDRDALYAAPPARALLVHDWVWRRRGTCGAVVSIWLLKRVNLVLR